MLGAAFLTGLVAGCGDVGSLELDLIFPDAETEARTRALRIVVREGDGSGTGCEQLWNDTPTGARQSQSILAYPNRNDALAAAISLDYPSLALFVFAYPGIALADDKDGPTESEFETVGDILAGGCTEEVIEDPEVSQEIQVFLELNPATAQ